MRPKALAIGEQQEERKNSTGCRQTFWSTVNLPSHNSTPNFSFWQLKPDKIIDLPIRSPSSTLNLYYHYIFAKMMQELINRSMSSSDLSAFEWLHFLDDSTDFANSISDGEDEDGLQSVLGDFQVTPASTLDAIEETLQICGDIDNDFGLCWSSLRGTFDDEAGGCTVVSEDSDDHSSAESEMDVVMLKLNACMKRSAESRIHVEQIAETLKKMTASSSASTVTPIQRPHKSSYSCAVGVVYKRRQLSSNKGTKIVRKRKDFAVTGCLVRPVLLDAKISAVPFRRPLVAPYNKIQQITKQTTVHFKGESLKGTTSISDFLRKAKGSPY